MKLKSFAFTTLLITLLISCSNNQTVQENASLPQTIKSTIQNKAQEQNWIDELEKDRLTKKIAADNEFMARNVNSGTEVYNFLINYKSPLYPGIENLGSLDTSSLDSDTLTRLNNFCKNFSTDYSKNISKYFNYTYIYNCVFFMNDLEKGWAENYKEDFPQAEEGQGVKLFDSWYIGSPYFFQEDAFAQIPVLFTSDSKKLYVKLLINLKESNPIYEAYIYMWEGGANE
jgi:hypothetical protein